MKKFKPGVLDEGNNPQKINHWTTWTRAVRESLCFAYEHQMLVFGARTPRVCSHEWCDGILDVLDRVYCDEERYRPLYG